MASGTLFPAPWFTALDANGNPLSGAKAWFYVAGTTTLATTYSDVALTTANANPVIADSAGRIGPVYLTPGGSYKFVLQDSSGAAIRTQDNIAAVPPSSINTDITGTAGEALTAGQVVYLSDGSGGKTAGSWYKADNTNPYSSSVPEVGIVPSTIVSGGAGTIRIGGQATGLSALTVGTTYYIGTGGALTNLAPTNRRVVGVADTTSSLILTPNPSVGAVDNRICCGRLTLTSGLAVTSADVTGATILYYTPYQGNQIALYDGTTWTKRVFTELSIAVPATASQMYDVFLYDNAGAVALELTAWTNDTTRATGVGTQDWVPVKSGAATRRYVGSFRTTTVSGQTEDSASKRFVWNYYNRVRRSLSIQEATSSWTYGTAAFRQANGAAANLVAIVTGAAEVLLELVAIGLGANATIGTTVATGIGEDTTTAVVSGTLMQPGTVYVANDSSPSMARLVKYPSIGYHAYYWLEYTSAAATTFFGTAGASYLLQTGMTGFIEG